MTPERPTREQPPDPARLRLSVVIPVHNSSSTLTDCVRAAVAAAGPDDEIILADDGSTDGCVANLDPALLARVEVVTSPVNIGRGPVRNLGVESSTGDVLVFVDSDVAIEVTALDRIRSAFEADPERAAVIGSYDDHPHDAGRVSQYRNLLHHHTHHTHGSSASHFWTGIGAIRKDVFTDVGGLDTARWARDLEDIEFGHRIIDAGYHIEVMPDVCGTHYKSFTVRSMIRVDLRERAIPWSHLMISRRFRSDPFVTSPPQVLSALAVAVLLVALALTPVFDWKAWVTLDVAPLLHWMGWIALAALLAFLALNASLWRFLVERRGLGFALLAIPLHILHTTISGVGFVIAASHRLARRALGRPPGPPPRRRKRSQRSSVPESPGIAA